MAMAPMPSGYATSDYTARRNYTTGRGPVITTVNGITIAIEKSPSWDKVAHRYQGYKGKEELKRTGLIKWAMREGVKVWQSQMDIEIYKAPLPKSALGNPEAYLQRARTGRTREALMEMPDIISGFNGDSGGVVINRSHFQGFYYPLTQEFGSTKMRYRAMHMRANTKAIMSPKFSAEGRRAMHDIKLNLKTT